MGRVLKQCISIKIRKEAKWLRRQVIKSVGLLFDKPVRDRNIPR